MEENKTTIKVLFIAINTSDKPNEYWEEILNNVQKRINNIKQEKKHINFEFIIKINISPHDLCDIIRDEEPDILHFQGHGEEAGLMFSDENDKSVVAYGRGIRDTLRALTDPTRKDKLHLQCILFNCCFQYSLAEDLLDYTRFAIGTASELEIDVAKSFAGLFYSSLCRGDSYKQAYELGKGVVKMTRKSIPIQNHQMLLEGRLSPESKSLSSENNLSIKQRQLSGSNRNADSLSGNSSTAEAFVSDNYCTAPSIKISQEMFATNDLTPPIFLYFNSSIRKKQALYEEKLIETLKLHYEKTNQLCFSIRPSSSYKGHVVAMRITRTKEIKTTLFCCRQNQVGKLEFRFCRYRSAVAGFATPAWEEWKESLSDHLACFFGEQFHPAKKYFDD